ncbi:MAG: trypsin-like serine protease, partial [Microvirga sp.]
MQRLVTLCLALSLVATQANAIVGGAEDEGPLARQSVMVLGSNGGVCSAVVLAKDVVLTAAHCVTGAAEHRVHFRDETGEPVLITPAAKAVHPGYNAKAIETRQRS